MKVLLSAYYCEPGRGGEPAVGWNCAREARRYHEVWVITRPDSRAAIEGCLAKEPMRSVHWVYFDLPRWGRWYNQTGRGIHLHYCLWQIAVYFVARRLHRQIGFDLVHHVTFGALWYPTFLALLPVPFVWGPVGAGYPCPRAFHREFSFRGRANEWVRRALLAASRLDPIRRHTERRASMILAVSPVTVQQLRPRNREKALLLSAVGVDRKEIVSLPGRRSNGGGRFRVLSVGRLLHWKGFALGVKAFALFNKKYPDSEYCIIGDGPERTKLRQLVSSMGLAGSVRLAGALSRADYLHELAHSDALLYPGLHEPGAYVIAEAMAARLPVVCLDFGEPASIVSDATGIKISMSNPERVVVAISEACAGLAAHPALCDLMGEAGRRRVLDLFEWGEKGRFLARVYEEAARGGRP